MCNDCVEKLSRAFSFRKQCREADEYLRLELDRCEEQNVIDDLNSITLKDNSINNNYEFYMPDNFIADFNSMENIEQTSNLASYYANITYELNDDDMPSQTDILNDENLISTTVESAEQIHNNEASLFDRPEAQIELDDNKNVQNPGDKNQNICKGLDKNSNSSPVKKKLKRSGVESVRDRYHKCFECEAIFTGRTNYNYHILQCHKTKNENKTSPSVVLNPTFAFVCEHCGRRFRKKNMYQRHLNLHDPNNPNICQICGKVSADKAALKIHSAVHDKSKPFKCDVCGQCTNSLKTLQIHMRFHTGERPYKCSHCNEAFITSSHLTVHERKHLNLAYKCDTCQKVYISERRFKRHLRIHDGGHYKYDCTYCEQKFVYAQDRNTHLYSHVEFEPLICIHCGKKLVNATAMDIHVRMTHSKGNVD